MLDQLKSLVKNGERYIVVEEGRPECVLLSFQDYLALTGGRKSNPGYHRPASSSYGESERVNAELDELSVAEPMARTAGFSSEPAGPLPDPTTIRLEDLPL